MSAADETSFAAELPALLVCALVAYSVHEHQEGHARNVTITLGEGGFTIEDDGRGMGLHRTGYAENLMGTLVGGPGAVQLHGVGLSLVAAWLAPLTVQSWRDGRVWTQHFVRGLAEGPPTHEAADGSRTGTRMTARWWPGLPAVDAVRLQAQLQRPLQIWRERHPQLAIRLA